MFKVLGSQFSTSNLNLKDQGILTLVVDTIPTPVCFPTEVLILFVNIEKHQHNTAWL